jgi:hypothetical protein
VLGEPLRNRPYLACEMFEIGGAVRIVDRRAERAAPHDMSAQGCERIGERMFFHRPGHFEETLVELRWVSRAGSFPDGDPRLDKLSTIDTLTSVIAKIEVAITTKATKCWPMNENMTASLAR